MAFEAFEPCRSSLRVLAVLLLVAEVVVLIETCVIAEFMLEVTTKFMLVLDVVATRDVAAGTSLMDMAVVVDVALDMAASVVDVEVGGIHAVLRHTSASPAFRLPITTTELSPSARAKKLARGRHVGEGKT